MPTSSRMSLIKGEIEPECPELFALEFGKIAEYDCLRSSLYKYSQAAIHRPSLYRQTQLTTKKHWEQTSYNVILTRLNGIFKYRHRRTFVGTNLRNLMNCASVYRNFLSLCFTVVDMP